MDLSDSVILPREDFLELQAVSMNQPPQSTKERAGNLAYVSLMGLACAATVTAATWGWASAVEWHEKRKNERENTETFPTMKDLIK